MHQNAPFFRIVGMEDNFELPESLRSNILKSIHSDEKRRAKKQLAVSVFVVTISLGAVVASVKYAVLVVYQSSFYLYLSLMLSDFDIVLRHWREFCFALLESLPVAGMLFCLVAMFALLVSIEIFSRSQKMLLTSSFSS